MARRSTQLFIGRLPLEARQRDLESVFLHYGKLVRCDVRYGECFYRSFVVIMFGMSGNGVDQPFNTRSLHIC